MKPYPNPFKIDIAENKPMNGFDVALQVGGFTSNKQAQAFADLLVKFMTDDGEHGWHARFQ